MSTLPTCPLATDDVERPDDETLLYHAYHFLLPNFIGRGIPLPETEDQLLELAWHALRLAILTARDHPNATISPAVIDNYWLQLRTMAEPGTGAQLYS